MSKLAKVILGTLTLLPWVTTVLFFAFIVNTMNGAAVTDPELFKSMMGFHFVGVLANLVTMFFYVVHVLKFNTRISEQNTKLLWALMIFFGNMMATPIYFFLYILPEGEHATGSGAIDPRNGLV